MRIAVFTDADFDRASDVTTALGALLRHAPPDVRLRIYTLSALEIDEPEYLALGSTAIPLPFATRYPVHLPRLNELQRRLQADGIDAIHISTPGAVGLAARIIARRLHLPLIGSLHAPEAPGCGVDRIGATRPPAYRYLRWLFAPCDRVLVPSADAMERLVRAGWPADRLALWAAGVDADAFSTSRRSQRLRDDWHVSERRPAILCVLPLERRADVAVIEPLGSLLHRRGLSHRVIVAGDGPESARLQERCPDAILTGALAQQDLARVMASSDLLVAPGAETTTGQLLLQAQASGLPVLVAENRTAREHMRHGLTGLTWAADDVLGLGGLVGEVLTDPVRRRSMSEAARRFGQARSWNGSLDRVYALYRAVVEARSRGASPENRPSTAPVEPLGAR